MSSLLGAPAVVTELGAGCDHNWSALAAIGRPGRRRRGRCPAQRKGGTAAKSARGPCRSPRLSRSRSRSAAGCG